MDELQPSSVPTRQVVSEADYVGVMRAGRTVRKELLQSAYKQISHRRADSKSLATIGDMVMRAERFDDFVEEHGGDEMMLRVVCARVANRESLGEMCEQYVLDYGLMWEWLSEDGQRLDRYYRAQRGVADKYVSETVEISDSATAETLGTDKLRVDTRFKTAEKLDPVRFGRQEAGLSGLVENLADVLTRISERKRQPAVIEDAVVVSEPSYEPV